MSEGDVILALTRAGVLNAIILSFLSVQFVVPFAFVFLLWVVPVIFALEVFYLPWRLASLSALLLITVAFGLFGLDVGFWVLVYLIVGSVSGVSWRLHFPWLVTSVAMCMAFALSLAGLVLLVGWLVKVDWREVHEVLVASNLVPGLPVVPVMAAGLFIWAFTLSIGVDRLGRRVLSHLPPAR